MKDEALRDDSKITSAFDCPVWGLTYQPGAERRGDSRKASPQVGASNNMKPCRGDTVGTSFALSGLARRNRTVPRAALRSALG